MARKKENAEALRIKAKELLKKAEKMENAGLVKVGKLVKSLHDKGFEGFELGKFKKDVADILG